MNKTIKFTKMSGAGNDFVVIDAPKTKIDLKKLTLKVCDRTNGIGADGLLVLDKSPKADYRMRIINADGSEAEMCGNGARCMAAYIVNTKKPKKKLFMMDTLAGIVEGSAKDETAIVHLSDPKDYKAEIPLDVNERSIKVSFIDTGVPHAIVFVENLSGIDVKDIGHSIRFHEAFKLRGTNVNFVEHIAPGMVHVRTYERGVEDETKACGTGSVASAIIGFLRSHPGLDSKKKCQMKVKTSGGEILEVTFDLLKNQIQNVWLKGSARFIAKGEYYL